MKKMSIYKKGITVYLGVFLMIFQLNVNGQPADRTLETKVADMLNETPAVNGEKLDAMMQEMFSLGMPAIDMVASMLVPPGTGDDTKARFMLGSMAFYATGKGRQVENDLITSALLNKLATCANTQVASFLIGRLQITANEKAIQELTKRLKDKDLVDPAVRALVAIGTQDAERALIKALKNKDVSVQTAVVQGLGDMRSEKASKAILKLAKTNDEFLKKTCLYALAGIPCVKAESILLEEAEKHNFQMDNTNAVASLLLYAERLGETGEKAACEGVCRKIMDKCNQPGNLRIKIAALGILTGNYGVQYMPLLVRAMDSPYKTYRMAALNFAKNMTDENMTGIWVEQLDKVKPEARAEIISMLGNRKDATAINGIKAKAGDSDAGVREEVRIALARLDPEAALPVLLHQLKQGSDPVELKSIGAVLKWIHTDKMMSAITAAYPELSVEAKIVAIQLMGEKRVSQNWHLVFLETRSQNSALRKAAMASLRYLSGPENIPAMLDLLMEVKDPGEVKDIQAAVLAATQQIEASVQRAGLLLEKFAKTDESGKIKILGILAGVGGSDGLDAAVNTFKQGTGDLKEAALDALINWSGYEAATPLYEIAKTNDKYRTRAVIGYINLIDRSELNDDEKRLFLEKILPLSDNDQLKKRVIVSLGKTRTFQAMVLVSAFLDNPELQQEAAKAVLAIALPSGGHPGYTGELTKKYLKKAAMVLKGQESEYTKARIEKYLNEMPDETGFVPMFNGKDLSGWKGLVGNPKTRAEMSAAELAKAQEDADKKVKENWSVKDGMIVFNGHGNNLVSDKDYSDFELLVDWRITKDGDSGIYLRGSPQVQIWDTSRVESGAQVGSGGLYNNKKHRSIPLKVADNPVGEWNTFRIRMMGERVSVWLNGELVVDNVVMDNYWERDKSIYPTGPIELQAHGTDLNFRNIYIREISSKEHNKLAKEEQKEGFVLLFNGENLDGWVGNKTDYFVKNGEIVILPKGKGHGNLYTEKEYKDFIFKFEFKLTPGANNGLGIRTFLTGDAAYSGMELQILDNTASIYKNLKPYQYHGSLYGVIPAKRGYLKPVGKWNEEEVTVKGTYVKVVLNGHVILDADWSDAIKNGTMDHKKHPGLKNEKGHIGFLGHGSEVHFRDIRIKELD